jgi:hypothetical protein
VARNKTPLAMSRACPCCRTGPVFGTCWGSISALPPADTGIFVESGVSLTLVSGIAGVADLLGTPPKPIGENQAAVGNRGSRARWPDLTQTLQPLRPAVACSLAPAGSLSHESQVNSSPPSIKLPFRTSNSIPPGRGSAMRTEQDQLPRGHDHALPGWRR